MLNNNGSDNIQVEVVDMNGNVLFEKDKLQAHKDGDLHKAFSIFVFNNKSELLLQQRAPGKYHSGGLWSNTCCSHPLSGEPTPEAASRRLREEMGISCDLTEIFTTQYKFECDNGLIEHEFNTVFKGEFDGEPKINPLEVSNTRWIKLRQLRKEVATKPKAFTSWLPHLLDELYLIWI
ncbi:isopentenyl-diphosphate Delta-isomerase [Alteromonas sp. I4]|nr:isopentenyl-diphosphate Delta-isomerase [Alteromonas sp. I4]